MELHAACIRRPVLTIVLSLTITLLGLVGLSFLGVREYPAVEAPVISILANYAGANSDVIQSQVTEPLEEAVNTVAGVRSLSSTSRDGASRIRVEFELGVDLDAAANDVRDQVSRALRLLPRDMDPPSISKADADSGAILTLLLRSETLDLLELSALADRVKNQVQTVAQVGSVDILGEKRYAMKLRLDPERLAAHGLTIVDVQNAVRRENLELPGGRLENATIELPVQTLSRLSEPAQFEQLVIAQNGDRLVRLREVGQAELRPQNERISFTVGGVPMVGLAIRPQPGANQVAIADEVHARLERIRAGLPSGVRLEVASDTTQFVRLAIVELIETIALAVALVVAVIFLFLRSWRATLIPAVVIPISLTGGLFVMYLAGYSLNVLTLLGLVLAVGLVVDDAIVVLENVHRRAELGEAPLAAAEAGTREVFVAVIATTLAVIAVFSPVLFLPGFTGRLFREFGVVIAGAVAVSAFVALTLTPMLAARVAAHPRRSSAAGPAGAGRLARAYATTLRAGVRRPWLAAVALVGCSALAWQLYRVLPKELSPLEDRGRISVNATGPEGASFEYMKAYMERLARAVEQAVPEAAFVTCQVPASGARSGTGVSNTGLLEVILKPRHERRVPQQAIAERVTRLVRQHPGARTSVGQEVSIGDRRGGNSIQYVVKAATVAELKTAIPPLLDAVSEAPETAFADVDLKFTRPELRVDLERERMQVLGVSATTVAQTLQAAFSGQRIGYFLKEGQQYDVIGEVEADLRATVGDIGRLRVRTGSGQLVALDNVVTLSETVSPPQLYRFDRQAAATVALRLVPGRTLADGLALLERQARAHLPPSVGTALTGAAADFAQSNRSLAWGFGLALVFVYFVLAAQFESWRDPLVIMLTVPLAVSGALLSLWACGQTINLFSQIGMVMLIGLVTKNGILLVEFAHQRRLAGEAREEAVINAAALRLRPILMTSLATVLGALPIALALGAGAEGRVSLGIGVIGGLVIGSALTLYVVPAMYLLIGAPDRAAAPTPAGATLAIPATAN